jgi:hypothetical protein
MIVYSLVFFFLINICAHMERDKRNTKGATRNKTIVKLITMSHISGLKKVYPITTTATNIATVRP